VRAAHEGNHQPEMRQAVQLFQPGMLTSQLFRLFPASIRRHTRDNPLAY
jgi:hypothetical protein